VDPQYSLRLKDIEEEIDRWLPKPEAANAFWSKAVFAEVGDVPLLRPLLDPCRDLLDRGGKRWRPLLMTLVCEALGGGDSALPLTPLVEFSHNASLIHDDIEDGSEERRGKPAVHRLYGTDAAINSGSFLYFLASACIDSWAEKFGTGNGDAAKARVYGLWALFMRNLHLGQAMDIHWHRNPELVPSVDLYFRMCARKTGCLARFAAELGVTAALFAGKLAQDRAKVLAEKLGTAAEKLGIGFQILDDVKNVSTGIVGKNLGDDIVEGKKSLPVILLLNDRPEKKEMVARCFAGARAAGITAPEVAELMEELAASGVIERARAQAESFIAMSGEVFSAVYADPGTGTGVDEKKGLSGLVNLIR